MQRKIDQNFREVRAMQEAVQKQQEEKYDAIRDAMHKLQRELLEKLETLDGSRGVQELSGSVAPATTPSAGPSDA